MERTVTVDDIIKRIGKKIKPQWWAAFFGCVICGLIAYMYIMTNNFLTYDTTWNIYSDQDMISSGRQFLTYACGIGSFYNLPWVNGVLAIFYLALTSIVVVEGLGIESKICAALTGGLLVTFPAVASTFCYIFTVDGYMLAVLLSALAFLITDRKKLGFLGGIVLLGISMGIYQAYLSFTIVLCILRLLVDVIETEHLKDIWAKIWRYVVMGIGAYVFYVVTLKLMLKWKDVEMSGYQGTDRVGSFSLADLLEGMLAALKNFARFFMPGNVLQSNKILFVSFCALLVITVGMYVVCFINKKRYKCISRIGMVFVLVLSIPFGATVVNIISPDTFFHLLMRLPWALFLVFSLLLLEKVIKSEISNNNFLRKCISYITLVCTILLIGRFSIMANIVGFNLNERYEKTYATCVRIVDRIEQTPGYTTGTKVAVLGGYPYPMYYFPSDITKEDLMGFFGADGSVFVSSSTGYATIFKHYLNFTVNVIPQEDEINLTMTEEYASMPKFPLEGSVAFIGDVLVVKLDG